MIDSCAVTNSSLNFLHSFVGIHNPPTIYVGTTGMKEGYYSTTVIYSAIHPLAGGELAYKVTWHQSGLELSEAIGKELNGEWVLSYLIQQRNRISYNKISK